MGNADRNNDDQKDLGRPSQWSPNWFNEKGRFFVMFFIIFMAALLWYKRRRVLIALVSCYEWVGQVIQRAVKKSKESPTKKPSGAVVAEGVFKEDHFQPIMKKPSISTISEKSQEYASSSSSKDTESSRQTSHSSSLFKGEGKGTFSEHSWHQSEQGDLDDNERQTISPEADREGTDGPSFAHINELPVKSGRSKSPSENSVTNDNQEPLINKIKEIADNQSADTVDEPLIRQRTTDNVNKRD